MSNKNIVLIGMPGCGKTVIGQALASLSDRHFYDIDVLVHELSGHSVLHILNKEGEAAFRVWEYKATALAASFNNCIIATGGGAVLNEDNCRALAKNGRIYFIERALKLLPTQGRPLSVDLPALYKTRLPFYLSFAEEIIKNNNTIEMAAQLILKAHMGQT
ncbi:MAG: AAA family ATPase [Firmicutes bacterium]|nr:AAA family ATPase [Bacillota bacterium]